MSEEINDLKQELNEFDEEYVKLYEKYCNLRNEKKDLQQKIEQLEKENERLRTQVNTYEDPDDLTLFYMWLDEKAKDKIKQLEETCEYLERTNNRREDEIIELRDENVDLVSKNKQLENIRKEALIELSYMSTNMFDEDYDIKEEKHQLFLNILNKGSDKE